MLSERRWKLIRVSAVLAICAQSAPGAPAEDITEDSAIERGRYLIHAGGCISCHTADEEDAPPLAGGHALETPFGTFFAPNITPDVETGIGSWSDEDFLKRSGTASAPTDRVTILRFRIRLTPDFRKTMCWQ